MYQRGGCWANTYGSLVSATRLFVEGVGRWISKDPIGIQGGINLYEFCGNNVVNRRDPNGELWLTAVAVATTVAIVAYTGYKIISHALKMKRTMESADVNDIKDVMSKAVDCCSDTMTTITPGLGGPLPDITSPITDEISGRIAAPIWEDVFDKVRPHEGTRPGKRKGCGLE